MKKRNLILVLVLMMLTALLSGCGITTHVTDGEEVSIAVVVPAGFTDKSLNDGIKAGNELLKADHNLQISYIECKGASTYKKNLMDAADVSDVVIVAGKEFYQLPEVTAYYPTTKFLWIDSAVDKPEDYPNLICISYSPAEISYVAGYVAANLTETGIIATVGVEGSKAASDAVSGFEQGAKYAKADVVILHSYITDDSESELAYFSASELCENDADVIYQITENCGEGVFKACSEKGALAIGYGRDQKIEFREYDKSIICSAAKNVEQSVYDILLPYLDEVTFEGGVVVEGSLSNGYMNIVYGDIKSNDIASTELKQAAERISGRIREKIIVVKPQA